jgi:hypothetical protein
MTTHISHSEHTASDRIDARAAERLLNALTGTRKTKQEPVEVYTEAGAAKVLSAAFAHKRAKANKEPKAEKTGKSLAQLIQEEAK